MTNIENIQQAYIDFVLATGNQPKSVSGFSGKNNIPVEEFYFFFNSFDALEQNIWAGFASKTIAEITKDEVWLYYAAREKALSFFYNFFERLKSNRNFVVYSIKKQEKIFSAPAIFDRIKFLFENFCYDLIKEGVQSDELSDRKFFTNRYKDALWVQLVFVLNFWVNDDSDDFEKAYEAIEKGVNVTFDLFQRSPIEDLFAYEKFLVKNGDIREKMSFGNN